MLYGRGIDHRYVEDQPLVRKGDEKLTNIIKIFSPFSYLEESTNSFGDVSILPYYIFNTNYLIF